MQTIPRVLIVENDPRDYQLWQKLVSYWGFLPIPAEGEGDALIEDAKTKADLYRCQLALVDMRLRDNSDPSDVTGLDLIPELKPTKAIVLSGYGDQATSRKSILEKGAVSFVGKEEGPEILKLELEREAHKICGAFRPFQIEPPEMVNHIIDVLLNNIPIGYHDQIIDVFARLFPDAKHLYLEKLGSKKTPTDQPCHVRGR